MLCPLLPIVVSFSIIIFNQIDKAAEYRCSGEEALMCTKIGISDDR